MAEVNLLAALPKGKRKLDARSTKTPDHVRISREYVGLTVVIASAKTRPAFRKLIFP